jgi:tetratricopeptide (TPR) repeat protein
MNEARRLANDGAPERAIEILDALLTEIEQVDGNAADHYRPIVLGRKGIALFRAGKRNEAIALTEQALRLCEASGDQEGIKAYTKNLWALGTFEVSTAAGPRGLVIEDESGATLAPDEFRQYKGRIKWQVVGGPDVPAEARRLQQEGRTAGERKEFDLAVQLFTEAATVDPSWPQPLYDRAFTHLLKGDRTAALDDYQAVMELAPDGFFGTRQFIDLLAREMSGELPEGFAVTFDSIQWLPAEQQAHVLAQLVERFPSCAVAWCEWSRHESNLERRLEILDKGLSANGDPDTRAALRVNKGLVLINLGQSDAGKALLVSEANGASAAGRAMAEMSLQRGESASGTGRTVT